MLVVAFAITVLGVPGAPPPSLEDAAERHGPAVVGVIAGDELRPGFFVSSSGIAVAAVRDATLTDVVVELASGERRKARVLVRDDDGLALVEVQKLDKDGLFPSLGVGGVGAAPAMAPKPDAWVLGIAFFDGRPQPTLGGLRRVDDNGRWRLDLPLDPGAPIIAGGRVVGVVVQRAGTTASVAVPAARITELVKRLPAG